VNECLDRSSSSGQKHEGERRPRKRSKQNRLSSFFSPAVATDKNDTGVRGSRGSSPSPSATEAWSKIFARPAPRPQDSTPMILENFVTEEETGSLLAFVNRQNGKFWKESTFDGQVTGSQRWGHVFMSWEEGARQQSAGALPPEFSKLIERMCGIPVLYQSSWCPDHANSILYRQEAGDYLKFHVDDRQMSDDFIVTLSLESNATMTFIEEKPKGGAEPRKFRIALPARCLQVQFGSVRYQYQHGISNSDLTPGASRVSITFRCSTKRLHPSSPLQSLPPKRKDLTCGGYGPALFYNFITEEEEQDLLAFLERGWKPSYFNGRSLGQGWGASINLQKRVLGPKLPLPVEFGDIIERIVGLPELRKERWAPDNCNAVLYERKKGHWLKAHCDDRQLSDGYVVNLTLLGRATMTFHQQKKKSGPEEIRALLPRRSLQIMSGRWRYDYTHGIAAGDLHDDVRISLNFRRCSK
jgi:alkylated DNA repair dioxygenase AlkB